jgi:hypothetical protein
MGLRSQVSHSVLMMLQRVMERTLIMLLPSDAGCLVTVITLSRIHTIPYR